MPHDDLTNEHEPTIASAALSASFALSYYTAWPTPEDPYSEEGEAIVYRNWLK